MGKHKQKCDRDCFNCRFKDCVVSDLSYEEYREIEDRKNEVTFPSNKAKWNKEHPDVIKKARKKHRQNHLEQERQKCRDYYYNNRERILERNKTDYMRDYKREYMRKVRAKRKELLNAAE